MNYELSTHLKQQLLKCLVPQARAHSCPQLSQLKATGFVEPNSQIAIPRDDYKQNVNRKKLQRSLSD